MSSEKSCPNCLLAVLSPNDRALLAPLLEPVDLDVRQIIEKPNEPVSHVYFVQSGMISIVSSANPNHRIEVGLVGREGMTGLCILLGGDQSANEAQVQSSGSALRIPAKSLGEVMDASRTLTSILLRYVYFFTVQATQTALANGRGRLDERLARWLLMWHDRVEGDELTVTHSFMALLLGVRRPSITDALHELEGKKLIHMSRSLVRIRNRDGLQRAASGFYGAPEAEYDRLFGTKARQEKPR